LYMRVGFFDSDIKSQGDLVALPTRISHAHNVVLWVVDFIISL